MLNIISLGVLFVLLLTLACGNGSEPENPSPQPAEISLVAPPAEPSMWFLVEMEAGEFDGESLTLPISLFQGPEFLTLDSLDSIKYVTFTKATNGYYYAYIPEASLAIRLHFS